MTPSSLRRGSMALALFLAPTDAGASTQVGLRVDGRSGQAVMFRFAGGCRAITAGHVMADAVAGTLILAAGREYRVRLLKGIDSLKGSGQADLAIVSVETADSSICPDPFFPASSEKALINQSVQAQIRLESNGLLGGTITGHSDDYSSFEMRPYDVGDPRLERGISGALVTVNNQALGIVTKIEGSGTTRVARVVSLSTARTSLSEFLPSNRAYRSYDLSWWPMSMAAAVKKANDSVVAATDAVGDAQSKEREARAIVGRAIAIPQRADEVAKNSVYYYLTDKGANRVRSEIKITVTQFPNYTYNLHGLGESRADAARAAVHPVRTEQAMKAWLDRVPRTNVYPPDFEATLKGQGSAYVIEMSTAPGCLPCGDLWIKLGAMKARYGWATPASLKAPRWPSLISRAAPIFSPIARKA